jgi:hypothetical protein
MNSNHTTSSQISLGVRRRPYLGACIVTLALAPALAFSEDSWLVDNDLRLTVSALPESYSAGSAVEYGDQTDTIELVDGTFSSAYWVALDYQARFGSAATGAGFLVGAGIDSLSMKAKESGAEMDLTGLGGHLTGGGSYRAMKNLDLEAVLLAGFGSSDLSFKGADLSDTKGSTGDYAILGAIARVVYTFEPGFQVSAQGGYTFFVSDNDITVAGEKSPQEITLDGFTYGLGAGWRF